MDSMCGGNTIWSTNSTTQWVLTEDDDCVITLTPFRGVKQAAEYAFTGGDADDFVADCWPTLAQAICDGIAAVVDGFECDQIELLECIFTASERRNRFRFLDGTISVSYGISEGDGEAFSDDDLTSITEAGETALTETTLEGAVVDEDSIESASVAGEEIDFSSGEDGEEDSSSPSDDTNNSGDVSGARNIFSVALISALCLIMGLLGQ